MSNLNIDISSSLEKIKKLFEKKEKLSIGVDIGTTRVRVVELERTDKAIVLKRFVSIKVNQEMIKAGTVGLINPNTGVILAELFKKVGIKGKNINVAVPSFASLLTTLELPAMPESEIDAAINLEAARYIPIPLKDVVYGWQVISDGMSANQPGKRDLMLPPDKTQKTKVLLVALMQEVSHRYEEVLGAAGFKVNCLEIDSFSLKRAIVGNDKGNYMIIDVGEKVANIIISSNGAIMLSRNIDVAGARITEVIARGMKVAHEKAEQLKKSNGIKIDSQFGSPLISETLKPIILEAKKAQETFIRDTGIKVLDGIILNGGTAVMIGFKDYIESNLGVKTIMANPWARIAYDQKIQDQLLQQAPYFAVSVGLALLGFEQ